MYDSASIRIIQIMSMGVKILLNQWCLTEGPSIETQFEIEDLDLNLIDCIQEQIGGDHFITFRNYYRNGSAMLYDRVYPFILRNGEYHWYVSYGSVSVREFMETNNIVDGGQIEAEIDQYGGAGDLSLMAILTWVSAIGKGVKYTEYYFNGLEYVRTHLIGENKRIIDLWDIIDFIQRKAEWKLKELEHNTKIDDDTLAIIILKNAGYRYRDGKYVFDKQYWEDMLNDIVEKENFWEVDPVVEDFTEVAYSLTQINMSITAIRYQSEEDATYYYNKVRSIADQLRGRWPQIICRGQRFRYLRIRKKGDPVDGETMEHFERDTYEVNERINKLLIEYDDNHRLEVDFNPHTVG